MNKYTFLGELQTELEKYLAPSDVKDALDYYENYILEASEYGQEEAQVLKELGDPRGLAKAIIAELEEGTKKKEEANLNDIVCDVVDALEDMASDVNAYATKQINRYFDEDIAPLDGNYEFVDRGKKILSLDEYTQIEVKAKNGNVKVGLSPDECLHVYQEGTSNEDAIEYYKQGTGLVIRQRKEKVYSVLELKKGRPLVLLIPTSYKCPIHFNVKNGAISVEGQRGTLKAPIHMNCDNGYVKIKEIYLGCVDISCDNGMVELQEVLCLVSKISCCNGVVKYDIINNEYGKVIQASAKNGFIRLNWSKLSMGYLYKVIPSSNHSQFQLQVYVRCDNGLIKLTGF